MFIATHTMNQFDRYHQHQLSADILLPYYLLECYLVFDVKVVNPLRLDLAASQSRRQDMDLLPLSTPNSGNKVRLGFFSVLLSWTHLVHGMMDQFLRQRS